MQKLTETDKIVVHQVDLTTAGKFTSSKKLKEWLRLHPNFVKQGSKYAHIYENEFIAWKEQHSTQETPVETTQEDNTNA